jgi:hypothetical protein
VAGLVMCRQDPERHPPGSDHATNAPLTRTGIHADSTFAPGVAALPVLLFFQSSADIHIDA